ncbi:AAA family ATPase [Rhodovulum euryhalinum]|uniref:DNA transposition AAA+ family ATPase n=1 Tax=Rhodovulum euryhalinum TaxID=35805 RepID=A0A4R2KH03_9RHOB|nr:AAA family ATPase [Rhodovulum euryhalinum]TCO73061.1 DNA transposition AAA+ family ATPase [Rhodovulum euryhalinum]
MTANVHMIKPEAPPVQWGFIETRSAQAMALALRRARAKGKIVAISAASGVGKTATVFHLKQDAPGTLVFTAKSGEGGVWNLACGLCNLLGLEPPNGRDLAAARAEIADKIGPDGFLVIDEAQYLIKRNPRGPDDRDALEWARQLAEEGFFALALVGDLRLDKAINDLPQLKRRTHPRVTISHATEADVDLYCRARGLHDDATIRKLADIARRNGGLGDVEDIFATARDLGKTGVPTVEDILAALEYLEFTTRRAK